LIGALSARLRGGRADIEYSTVDVRYDAADGKAAKQLGIEDPANAVQPRRLALQYDLQTGKFDVLALFSGDNAKAVVPRVSGPFDRRNIRLGADTR
jgi:hypothetical protein